MIAVDGKAPANVTYLGRERWEEKATLRVKTGGCRVPLSHN